MNNNEQESLREAMKSVKNVISKNKDVSTNIPKEDIQHLKTFIKLYVDYKVNVSR